MVLDGPVSAGLMEALTALVSLEGLCLSNGEKLFLPGEGLCDQIRGNSTHLSYAQFGITIISLMSLRFSSLVSLIIV